MFIKLILSFVIEVACLCESAVISQNPGLVMTQNIEVDNLFSDFGPYIDTTNRAMRLYVPGG